MLKDKVEFPPRRWKKRARKRRDFYSIYGTDVVIGSTVLFCTEVMTWTGGESDVLVRMW